MFLVRDIGLIFQLRLLFPEECCFRPNGEDTEVAFGVAQQDDEDYNESFSSIVREREVESFGFRLGGEDGAYDSSAFALPLGNN